MSLSTSLYLQARGTPGGPGRRARPHAARRRAAIHLYVVGVQRSIKTSIVDFDAERELERANALGAFLSMDEYTALSHW